MAGVVEQFTATIETGQTFFWSMQNAHPPFNRDLSRRARPRWLVEWQAVPLVVEVDIDSPGIQNAKAGLEIPQVIVVQEADTSLSHRVAITCHDMGNPPPGARFIVTYVLYAIFHDI
ncbi:MAG TPA: hypothetical protein VFZ91_16550 [Allosphingosinicella sp.]